MVLDESHPDTELFEKIFSMIVASRRNYDTFSDEEFFYSVPYDIVDLILYARENNMAELEIEKISDLSTEQIKKLLQFQNQKQVKSQHMREIPHSWKKI